MDKNKNIKTGANIMYKTLGVKLFCQVFSPASAFESADSNVARNPQRFIHVTVGRKLRKTTCKMILSIKMIRLTLIYGLLILISCNQTKTNSDSNLTAQPETNLTDKLISKDLGHGFKITFGDSEDFSDFMTYWDIKLYKANVKIFSDTTTEFEIKSKYPSIRKIGEDYEILLYVNDRPSIDKLLILKTQGDNIISKELIPYFEMLPMDIDSDGKLELVGIMSYYEMAGENGNMMPYVPILVYEYSDSGITLDSVETKNVNIRVYNKFYGFDYSEKYEFKGNDRFENELNKYK
jgi:hypothetical protein